MDFGLNAKQQEWVSKAESIVPQLRANSRKYDDSGNFPADSMELIRKQGFLKLGIPAEFGGAHDPNESAGFTQYLVVEKLSEGCSSTGWNMMIHWVNQQVVTQLSEGAIRRRVLTDIAQNGKFIGSLGSEVNTSEVKASMEGSSKLNINAAFQPVKGGFLVNGKKHFATMAPAADWLLVWALAPGGKGNADGLVISIIPASTPGIKFDRSSWDECIGLRATVSWSADLKDVMIPWENVMGDPGAFVQKDPLTFDLGHCAHFVGSAQGILDFAIQMARDREYLAKDEVYMYWLSEMQGAIQAARTSFWYTNWLWEQRRFDECLLASYNALHTTRQTALMVADKAFEICGTRALFKFNPIDRTSRDIRAAALHTRDTQLARIQTEAILNRGRIFSKRKYGERLAPPKTWQDFGLKRELADA